MRGTPRILRYRRANRVCKNAQVRTIRREGRSTRSEPSETARRAPAQGAPDDDTVHAPWRHGENVNKVSVGEPADGSPPKFPFSGERGSRFAPPAREGMKRVYLGKVSYGSVRRASGLHRFFVFV